MAKGHRIKVTTFDDRKRPSVFEIYEVAVESEEQAVADLREFLDMPPSDERPCEAVGGACDFADLDPGNIRKISPAMIIKF